MKATIRKFEKKKKEYEFDAIAFTYKIGETKTRDFIRMFENGIPSNIIDMKITLDVQKRMKMYSSEALPNGNLWFEDAEDIVDAVKEHLDWFAQQEKEDKMLAKEVERLKNLEVTGVTEN